MFSSDHNEKYPTGDAAGLICSVGGPANPAPATAKGSLSLLNPDYVKTLKSFICPSNALSTIATTKPGFLANAGADATTCHYAFYVGLNESVRADMAIAMDETFNDGTSVSNANHSDLTVVQGTAGHNTDLNHGIEGVNVLFAGGHVKWIQARTSTTPPTVGNKFLEQENIPTLMMDNFINPDNS
jgi:prepilin-type processing-associated H-X9-DG protein